MSSTITGLSSIFAPGTVEYKRVDINTDKSEYYRPSKMATILLSGMGTIIGGKETNDMKKGKGMTLKSAVVDQMEFEITTHEPRLTLTTTFVTGNLTTGTYGTAKTFTVADASILRPGDTIRNRTTNEQLYVTAVNTSASPNEITAFPGFNQANFQSLTTFPWSLTNGTPAAKTNGDVISIVSTAASTGSTSGTIIDSRPNYALNYVQVFREEFGDTWEAQQTVRRGRMDLKDKEDRARSNLLIKMERGIIEGQLNKQNVTAASGETQPVYTTQGIEGVATAVAASALTGGGNDITRAKLSQIAALIQDGNRSGFISCFCSTTFVRKIEEIMKDQVETQVVAGDEKFGLKAVVYENTFLPIYFIAHDLYNSTGKDDEALFFDAANLRLRNLRNGELGLISQKKGLPYGGLTDNAKMAQQDGIYGAYGLEYKFMGNSSRYLTGLSHTIAG